MKSSFYLLVVLSVSFSGSLSTFGQDIQATSFPRVGFTGSVKITPPSPAVSGDQSVLANRLASSGYLRPGMVTSGEPDHGLPKVFAPTQPRNPYTRFPWKTDIVTTVFWVGEKPTANNPTPNTMSAWDRKWTSNFGGYDNPAPEAREGYLPKAFEPKQNPFYFALPYNDICKTGTKDSAETMIPWFRKHFVKNGHTVLKGRWIAIRRGNLTCYAQWEDVGPWETDDAEYVFGDSRPKAKGNRGAGLDVSPAVRDYLEFDGGYGTVDWRFVDLEEVPDGPWKQWGNNNPFTSPDFTEAETDGVEILVRDRGTRLLVSNEDESETTTPLE